MTHHPSLSAPQVGAFFVPQEGQVPDDTTTETEATETEAAPEATEETAELDPEKLKAEVAKLRREAASWRTKYREAEPHVAKAKELEEANKTEAEKLAEARATAEERASKAETRLMRLEACLAAGLDRKFAARLEGSTAEELEADAKELAELFAGKSSDTPTPDPGRKPRARLDTARPNPGAPDVELDPSKIAEKALKGYL